MMDDGRLKDVGALVQYVTDIDRSLAFYRDVLGLDVGYEQRPVTPDQTAFVTFQTGGIQLSINGDGARDGTGPRLVFKVPDFFGTRQALLDRGVDVAEPLAPVPGILIAEFRDPDGNLLVISGRGELAEVAAGPVAAPDADPGLAPRGEAP